jgi:hypothetical protein
MTEYPVERLQDAPTIKELRDRLDEVIAMVGVMLPGMDLMMRQYTFIRKGANIYQSFQAGQRSPAAC